MSHYHYLIIKKQTGPVVVDLDAVHAAKLLRDLKGELFEQHGDPAYHGENLFTIQKGKLKIYDGGYDSRWLYDDRVNLYGYDAKSILKILAKHMTKGSISFFEDSEGDDPTVWMVEPGKVTQI